MKEKNLWLTYEAGELDALEKVCEEIGRASCRERV